MSNEIKEKRSKEKDQSRKERKEEKERKKEKKIKESKEKKNEKSSEPVKRKSGESEASPESKKQKSNTSDAIKSFWEQHQISVSGRDADQFMPCLSFESSGLPADLLERACGSFTNPTPIQSQCWPIAMAKRDMIGVAATGSGKTFAFALPAVARLGLGTGNGIQVLVMAPTRELAMQTDKAFNDAGMKSVCIYGGMPKHEQRRALRSKIQVVVATPGRLLDLIEEGCCSLNQVHYLVLDEADRMLDLGFEKDIRSIIAMTPAKGKRQTLMFSATWPQSVQKLASEFLHEPIQVTIGNQPDQLHASGSVEQRVDVIEDPKYREQRLLELLKKYHDGKNRIIIFALYKKEAARLETLLQQRGFSRATAIHGDMSQPARTEALQAFRDGTKPLLVATDVAARGLDIPNVEYVLNNTFPLTIEDYVHRIGRTGRGGKTGIAHTLFTPLDKAHSGALINVLKSANMPVPDALLKFGTTVKRKEHKDYGAFFKEVDPNAKSSHVTFSSDDEA